MGIHGFIAAEGFFDSYQNERRSIFCPYLVRRMQAGKQVAEILRIFLFYNDEPPGLFIPRGRRPTGGLEQVSKRFIIHGSSVKCPDTLACRYECIDHSGYLFETGVLWLPSQYGLPADSPQLHKAVFSAR